MNQCRHSSRWFQDKVSRVSCLGWDICVDDRFNPRTVVAAPYAGQRLTEIVTNNAQEALLASSVLILDSVVEDGYWDSTMSTPALGLLDGVIAGYGDSSGAVMGSDEMGEDAAKK